MFEYRDLEDEGIYMHVFVKGTFQGRAAVKSVVPGPVTVRILISCAWILGFDNMHLENDVNHVVVRCPNRAHNRKGVER